MWSTVWIEARRLYQEGADEWIHYKSWLDKNHPGADWRVPRLQSRFAAENLKKNYPGVWERMKNATTREEAAAAYTSGYLKPAPQYEASRIAGFRRHGVPPLEAFTGPAETHGAKLADPAWQAYRWRSFEPWNEGRRRGRRSWHEP
jgi:hypothetical protein